jgi:hypothetical protein
MVKTEMRPTPIPNSKLVTVIPKEKRDEKAPTRPIFAKFRKKQRRGSGGTKGTEK